MKAQNHVSDILREIPGIPKDWVTYGRLCSPRVLLLFYSQSATLTSGEVEKDGHTTPVKRLQHALEDQIYRILRKSRIITNVRYCNQICMRIGVAIYHHFT